MDITEIEAETDILNGDSEEIIIEKPKNLYIFKTIKNFEKVIDYQTVNNIYRNLDQCINLTELMIDAVEDDILYSGVIGIFPNLKPISNAMDRKFIKKMLLETNSEIPFAYGQTALEKWINESQHLGLIFRNESIVGSYQVIHRNKLACDIVIYLRGGFKDRAKTAKEMVMYWGSRYAKMIFDYGYKYALATTLTESHASLVNSVRKKECKIYLEKLKIEKPDKSIEELTEASKKLIPGFKNTGTVMPRLYEGVEVWETNWRYNLGLKYELV